MLIYWIVFCVFVTIGKVFFGYGWSAGEMALNFIGVSSSINYEWWYVLFYMELLFIAPILCTIYDIAEKYFGKLKVAVLFVLGMTLMLFIPKTRRIIISSTWFIFPLSYFIAKMNVYDKLPICKQRSIHRNHTLIKGLIGTAILLVIMVIKIILREHLHLELKSFDFILLPAFIYAIILLHSISEGSNVWKVLKLFGKYSAYIWLMHRFFYNMYFEKLVSAPKYSICIYIWLLLICLVASMILHQIVNKIKKMMLDTKKIKA